MRHLPAQCCRFRGGFTLPELLITLGIIAVLVVLLMAATSGVRQKSADVACIGQMRHLVLAIRSFQSENNGYLPPVNLNGVGVTTDNTWTYRIHPYMGVATGTEPNVTRAMAKHLTCPAEKTKADWNPITKFWQSHYGVNGSGDRTFHFDGRLQRPRIDDASRTMMLIETLGVRGLRARASSIASIAYRHQKLANAAYFDGRIEKIALSQVPESGGNAFWLEW